MAAKTRPVVERRNLYLPKPTEWDWGKLDPTTINQRLATVRLTEERLEAYATDLRQQREGARKALWARLPDALLYERQAALKQLEEMGKQLTQIGRLQGQARTAIRYIEERLAR